MRRWTQEESDLLLALHKTKTGAELAEALKRPLRTVRAAMSRMGLVRHVYRPWTPQEVACIKSLYPTTPSKEIAALLNRPVWSVHDKAHSIGVKMLPEIRAQLLRSKNPWRDLPKEMVDLYRLKGLITQQVRRIEESRPAESERSGVT